MKFLAISGDTLFLCLVGSIALILSIIFIVKNRICHQTVTEANDDSFSLDQRHKYRQFNIFRLSGTFLTVGLVLSLSLTILAFSWTTYEPQLNFSMDDLTLEDEDIKLIPRTATPPPSPPPPPPPPTVVLEVENDAAEAEDIEFVPIDIDEPVIPEPPKPTVTTAPPPPPPPPPPTPMKDPETIFVTAEEMPRFPGCEEVRDMSDRKTCADQKMLEFIYKNINYPPMARENHVQGTVVIRFYIDTDGSIKSPEILKDIGAGCGKEALRVVEKMNSLPKKWAPGKQRGKPVKVYFNLPVRYRLD